MSDGKMRFLGGMARLSEEDGRDCREKGEMSGGVPPLGLSPLPSNGGEFR